ncbi:MAG: SGNH/GDSL hydrolase family protein [Flammeovirgaceae bacterium]
MKSEALHFLALGDSYTIGERVAVAERWPVVLADTLSKSGIQVNAPRIIATTGWTTDELAEAIEKENITEKYGLVSLLIGVNNQYRGEAKGYILDQYKKEYRALVHQAIEFADGNKKRVFVVSIPDYSVTPFAKDMDTAKIHEELKVYNRVKREITEELGVLFLDITPISLEAKGDPALIAADLLHPSAKMYQRWVNEVIYESVYQLLK